MRTFYFQIENKDSSKTTYISCAGTERLVDVIVDNEIAEDPLKVELSREKGGKKLSLHELLLPVSELKIEDEKTLISTVRDRIAYDARSMGHFQEIPTRLKSDFWIAVSENQQQTLPVGGEGEVKEGEIFYIMPPSSTQGFDHKKYAGMRLVRVEFDIPVIGKSCDVSAFDQDSFKLVIPPNPEYNLFAIDINKPTKYRVVAEGQVNHEGAIVEQEVGKLKDGPLENIELVAPSQFVKQSDTDEKELTFFIRDCGRKKEVRCCTSDRLADVLFELYGRLGCEGYNFQKSINSHDPSVQSRKLTYYEFLRTVGELGIQAGETLTLLRPYGSRESIFYSFSIDGLRQMASHSEYEFQVVMSADEKEVKKLSPQDKLAKGTPLRLRNLETSSRGGNEIGTIRFSKDRVAHEAKTKAVEDEGEENHSGGIQPFELRVPPKNDPFPHLPVMIINEPEGLEYKILGDNTNNVDNTSNVDNTNNEPEGNVGNTNIVSNTNNEPEGNVGNTNNCVSYQVAVGVFLCIAVLVCIASDITGISIVAHDAAVMEGIHTFNQHTATNLSTSPLAAGFMIAPTSLFLLVLGGLGVRELVKRCFQTSCGLFQGKRYQRVKEIVAVNADQAGFQT